MSSFLKSTTIVYILLSYQTHPTLWVLYVIRVCLKYLTQAPVVRLGPQGKTLGVGLELEEVVTGWGTPGRRALKGISYAGATMPPYWLCHHEVMSYVTMARTQQSQLSYMETSGTLSQNK